MDKTISNSSLDVAPILQTAFAFWSSKVLLTAVEFGVFTQIADRHITGAELAGMGRDRAGSAISLMLSWR